MSENLAWSRLLHDGEVVLKVGGKVHRGRVVNLEVRTDTDARPVFVGGRVAGTTVGQISQRMTIEALVVDEQTEEQRQEQERLARLLLDAGPLAPDPGLLTEVFAREGREKLGPAVEQTAREVDAMPTGEDE
jgi:hypothetical protein